jgi:hypothetical protein
MWEPGFEGLVSPVVEEEEDDAWSRWYLRRKRRARTMKLMRPTPPIVPPTIAPVLLGLVEEEVMAGWEGFDELKGFPSY